MSLEARQATSARGRLVDLEEVVVGFANLGEVMAARAGNNGPPPQLKKIVPTPSPDADDGHWACFLWQTSKGSWQDVSDALEMSFGTTYRRAQAYARAEKIVWPLEKHIGERRVVREVIRGTK